MYVLRYVLTFGPLVIDFGKPAKMTAYADDRQQAGSGLANKVPVRRYQVMIGGGRVIKLVSNFGLYLGRQLTLSHLSG